MVVLLSLGTTLLGLLISAGAGVGSYLGIEPLFRRKETVSDEACHACHACPNDDGQAS